MEKRETNGSFATLYGGASTEYSTEVHYHTCTVQYQVRQVKCRA
jgi:hypothetical protein